MQLVAYVPLSRHSEIEKKEPTNYLPVIVGGGPVPKAVTVRNDN
jgi:hypothetical protein